MSTLASPNSRMSLSFLVHHGRSIPAPAEGLPAGQDVADSIDVTDASAPLDNQTTPEQHDTGASLSSPWSNESTSNERAVNEVASTEVASPQIISSTAASVEVASPQVSSPTRSLDPPLSSGQRRSPRVGKHEPQYDSEEDYDDIEFRDDSSDYQPEVKKKRPTRTRKPRARAPKRKARDRKPKTVEKAVQTDGTDTAALITTGAHAAFVVVPSANSGSSEHASGSAEGSRKRRRVA
ncbi:hypothetical protein NM688_g8893 [Phlebia brevispora]|uniref:Uncharacterized protein n=1 Tax=Phlebia brevispora TaxID=194682 RepID=A0ACC1RLR8_9APHY|nr:hypothetical protein NM688_g8893 [Phlebia brevispora]